MDKVDVIVIGGGIFGLACAHACARRGMSVRVLEAEKIASGASGGIVGALSPHVPDAWNPKKDFQFRALSMAPDFWAGVARLGGETGFRRAGRLMPILSEHGLQIARDREAKAQDLWQGMAAWQVCPSDHAPGLLDPDAAPFGIIHDTLAAHIFPRAACSALARAAVAQGALIAENWPVDSIGDGQVSGPGGTCSARSIIVAAGVPGFEMIAPGQGMGKGIKGQSALLEARLPADTPTLFADGIYVVPHGGLGTAVGSTSEPDWTHLAPDALLDEVITRARALCPALRRAAITRRWAGLRPKARRRDPLLGAVPGMPGVLAALGGFKIGFGIAPLVGEVLADLVEGVPVTLPDSFGFAHHAN